MKRNTDGNFLVFKPEVEPFSYDTFNEIETFILFNLFRCDDFGYFNKLCACCFYSMKLNKKRNENECLLNAEQNGMQWFFQLIGT